MIKTVLLVEDEPVDVILMQRMFKRQNLNAKLAVASDGEQAVAYLAGSNPYTDRAEHPLPYVVVLDLNLPRRSGFEVLSWIRGQERFRHLPVVVLTSSREAQDLKRAYSNGAN